MKRTKVLPITVVGIGILALFLGINGDLQSFIDGLKGKCVPCEIRAKIADAKAMHAGGG